MSTRSLFCLLLVAGCAAPPAPRAAAPAPAPAPAPSASSEAPTTPPHAAPEAAASPSAKTEWCAAPARSSDEGEHGVSGALALLNQEFLKAHANARRQACTELESERLVLRYAFGTLEARYRGKDLLGGPMSLVPAEYHPIKDVSHAVLLAALLFQDQSSEKATRTKAVLGVLDGAIAQLDDASSPTTRLIPSKHLPTQKRILHATREAVFAFSQGRLDDKAQRAFFVRVRPDLEENIRAVSGALLRELHRRVEEIKKQVPDEKAWQSASIIVGAVHQARAREIGVQYFERLLAEPVGEGARAEKRMVVSESIFNPPDQLGLLATHLVDQESAELVFGDPLRLQWDVLADDGGTLDSLLPR